MEERLQDLRDRFAFTMSYLRTQRNLMAAISEASARSFKECPDVIEHEQSRIAASDAVAAIDRLRASIIRSMDRLEVHASADDEAKDRASK